MSDSGAGSVEAHGLRDGQLVWSFGLARSAPMSSAALGGGAAFIGGGDGHLYALDVATGRPRWTVDRMGDQGWESFASPTVAGDTVIVGCSDGSVCGFGAGDGEQRWRIDIADPGTTWTSAHIADRTLTIASVHAKAVRLLAWDAS